MNRSLTEATEPSNSGVRLSVLVTPTKSGGSLTRLLRSLLRDCDACQGSEIVVVVPSDRLNDGLETQASLLRAKGLLVRILKVDPGGAAEVPLWRARAFEAASGSVRVFLEDNATIEPGWWQAWNALAGQDDWTIATGTVVADSAALSMAATGVFFCEYGLFVPRSGRGKPLPLKRVAGNHWAVHCGRIGRQATGNAIDEHVWTHRFVPPGQKPARNELAAVRCRREVGAVEAIVERARQGFRFGRDECRRARPIRRIKMVHGGHAIILVQIVRLVAVVTVRRSHRGLLLRSLPWTLALLKAWSFSEWAGWCYGAFEALFHANLKNRTERRGESPEDAGPFQGRVVERHEAASSLFSGTHARRRNVAFDFRIPS